MVVGVLTGMALPTDSIVHIALPLAAANGLCTESVKLVAAFELEVVFVIRPPLAIARIRS